MCEVERLFIVCDGPCTVKRTDSLHVISVAGLR